MDTRIVLSLSDLGAFVLWGLFVAILVLLILILFRFYRSFKAIMKIVDDNRPNVNKVLDEAPELTKNVNTIVREVAHGTEAFRDSVDNIAFTANSVTKSIKDNSDITAFMSSAFSVAGSIKNGFDSVFKDGSSKKTAKSSKKARKAEADTSGPGDSDYAMPSGKQAAAPKESSDYPPSSDEMMKQWDTARDTVKGLADKMDSHKS